MEKFEREWDERLKISTTGRDDSMEDAVHHAYEPTPYAVLERIRETGLITQENVLTDYGCGKGRAAFYLAQTTGCKAVGIDFDPQMIGAANENKTSFDACFKNIDVSFACMDAAMYDPAQADTFYFFNPFDECLLRKILSRIVSQSYESAVQSLLFFYYPSDEYLSILMTTEGLEFYDEIDTSDLFDEIDPRERVMIFSTEE